MFELVARMSKFFVMWLIMLEFPT